MVTDGRLVIRITPDERVRHAAERVSATRAELTRGQLICWTACSISSGLTSRMWVCNAHW